jgi:hypothetical protein
MKGIVFNLLEEVVRAEYGEDTWDTLLDKAGLDGAYTSLGGYPDTDMLQLVAAASAALNVPPVAVVKWFGVKAIPLLRARYPDYFVGHKDTRTFLMTLNSIIHPEVRKVYPGADVPVFEIETMVDERTMLMGYRSARQLCSLAEGFIEGSAAEFAEVASIEQPSCMHRGDERCLLKIVFTPKAA